MKTATSLALIAIGAILTFAIAGHPSFLNLQVAGVVVMATGVAGLVLTTREASRDTAPDAAHAQARRDEDARFAQVLAHSRQLHLAAFRMTSNPADAEDLRREAAQP